MGYLNILTSWAVWIFSPCELFEYSCLASCLNILLLQDLLKARYLKFDCIIQAIPQIYLHIYVYLVSVMLEDVWEYSIFFHYDFIKAFLDLPVKLVKEPKRRRP